MMLFWVIAACLIVAALLFVVPPLLKRTVAAPTVDHDHLNVSVYRDQLTELEKDLANGVISQEQHDRSRLEIERRMLSDVKPSDEGSKPAPLTAASRVSAIGIAVLLPVATLLIYRTIGTPIAMDEKAVEQVAAQEAESAHADTGKQVANMIAELQARLEQEPDNLEGWLMLARSYRFLKRHGEAAAAFEKALPVMEGNAQLLADYADTLAMSTNGDLSGRPIQLIDRALQADPTNVQALWLKGTHQYESQDYAGALQTWRRLQHIVPPGSEESQIMANNISEIESRMRTAGLTVPADDAPIAAAPAVVGVSGRVMLAAELQGKVAPGDTVFVFARAANGPRIPLAIVKKPAAELPMEFSLDSSMAMMPDMSLANYKDVVIGARISKTGNAMAQSGDLEGLSPVVQVGATGLVVTIDRAVP